MKAKLDDALLIQRCKKIQGATPNVHCKADFCALVAAGLEGRTIKFLPLHAVLVIVSSHIYHINKGTKLPLHLETKVGKKSQKKQVGEKNKLLIAKVFALVFTPNLFYYFFLLFKCVTPCNFSETKRFRSLFPGRA